MITMNGPDITRYDIPRGQTVRLVQWGGDGGGNRLMLGVVPANPAITITVLAEGLSAASTAFNMTGNSFRNNVKIAAMVKSTGWRYCSDLVVNVLGEPFKHGGYTIDLLYKLAISGDAKLIYNYSRVFIDSDALLLQNQTPGSYNCGTKAENYGPEIFGRPVSTDHFAYYNPFSGVIKREDLRFNPARLAGAIMRIKKLLDQGTPVRVWLAHDNDDDSGAESETYDFTYPITKGQATHFVLIFGYDDTKFLYLDPWFRGSIFPYEGGVYRAYGHEYIGEFSFDMSNLEYGIQKSSPTGGSMPYTLIAGP